MKRSPEQILNGFRHWQNQIPVGSVWKHYKGGIYEVVGHALNVSGSIEGFDIRYRRIDGSDFDAVAEAGIEYAREADQWRQVLDPNGTGRPTHIRFQKIRS